MTHEELLDKAKIPGQLAIKFHSFYQGKIGVAPKVPIRSNDDFAIWYTPGVAEPCRAIQKDHNLSFEYTNRGNTVAIVSDGSRVLGLGDIGPEAGLPVMEGKALLYKYLGGVDAFPIMVSSKDPEDLIRVCKLIEPSFGGINLEDIEKPKCFYVLENLRRELSIPVWHDDQQGTATVVLAGFVNALKMVDKKMGDVTVAMVGSGAANTSIMRLLVKAGLDMKKVIIVDSKGILHQGREDLKGDSYKWDLCVKTNGEGRIGGIPDALKGTDACIAMSTPGPGVIKKESVARMGDRAIVFACANPVPEIWPWEVLEAGAKVVATGRSDFPNQVNNSLGFPGIFRGTLDVRGTTITDEMCVAAAYELAKIAEEDGLREDFIIPSMEDWEVFPREAVAVGLKAIEQGVARRKLSRDEIYQHAFNCIKNARDSSKSMMELGLISPPPP